MMHSDITFSGASFREAAILSQFYYHAMCPFILVRRKHYVNTVQIVKVILWWKKICCGSGSKGFSESPDKSGTIAIWSKILRRWRSNKICIHLVGGERIRRPCAFKNTAENTVRVIELARAPHCATGIFIVVKSHKIHVIRATLILSCPNPVARPESTFIM